MIAAKINDAGGWTNQSYLGAIPLNMTETATPQLRRRQLLLRRSGGSGSSGDERRLDGDARRVKPNLRSKPIVVGGSGGSGTPLVMQTLLELGLESRVSNTFLDYYPLGLKSDALVQTMRRGVDSENVEELALQARKLQELIVRDSESKFARRPITHTYRRNLRGARNAASSDGGDDGALPWGWKASSSYLSLPVISRAFPSGFHFVHVLRDARYLIYRPISAREALVADVWFEAYNRALLTAGKVSHTERKQLNAAVLWTEANEAAESHARAMAVHGVTYNRVRVEDLAVTPDKSLGAVLRAIGLGAGGSNALASVVQASRLASSDESGVNAEEYTFDSWKVVACEARTAWDARFYGVLQGIIRHSLAVYGYEVDDGFDCATFDPTALAITKPQATAAPKLEAALPAVAAAMVVPESPPKPSLSPPPGVALLAPTPLTKPEVPISQVLIFGMHHTGTSILTIATHALGLFVGGPDDILWSPNNPLKFWERDDIVAADDAFMGQYATSHGPKWVQWGFEASTAEPAARATHRAAAAQIVSELDAHGPWATKDPRMCLLAAEWLELCSNPVCVLIERDTAEWAWSTARFSRRVLKLKSGSDHPPRPLGTWLLLVVVRRDEGAAFFGRSHTIRPTIDPPAQSETLTRSHACRSKKNICSCA